MAQYTCIRPCFHNSRLWAVGETFTAPDGEPVPEHFAKDSSGSLSAAIESKKKKAAKSTVPETMSEMATAQRKPTFIEDIEPDPELEVDPETLAKQVLAETGGTRGE